MFLLSADFQWYSIIISNDIIISNVTNQAPNWQVATTTSLVQDWNEALEVNKAIVKEHQTSLKRQWDAGEISDEVLLASWEPMPQKLSPPNERWGQWFLKAYGWSLLSRAPDSQAWLPYHHTEMVNARKAVQNLFQEGGVHPCCLLNYDQVWRNCWSFSGKLLMKERRQAGRRSKKRKVAKRADKKLFAVKGNRRSLTATWLTRHLPLHICVFPMALMLPRRALTFLWMLETLCDLTKHSKVLTTSWSDGTGGPLAFCLPEGTMSQEAVVRWNAQHLGRAMIVFSGTNSHFMSANVLLEVFEQLISPALRLQRARQDVPR